MWRKSVPKATYVVVLTAIVVFIIFMMRFMFFRGSISTVSAVEVGESLGVYWDRSCVTKVYSIDWGTMAPGGMKSVVVYVRNEGNDMCLPVLIAANWDPSVASGYLSFSWKSDVEKIAVGEIARVTQTLFVSPFITGVSSFSFDIVFEGWNRFLGDLDKNGVVDLLDLVILAMAYYSRPGDPNWNPEADLNADSVTDLNDLVLFSREYGNIW